MKHVSGAGHELEGRRARGTGRLDRWREKRAVPQARLIHLQAPQPRMLRALLQACCQLGREGVLAGGRQPAIMIRQRPTELVQEATWLVDAHIKQSLLRLRPALVRARVQAAALRPAAPHARECVCAGGAQEGGLPVSGGEGAGAGVCRCCRSLWRGAPGRAHVPPPVLHAPAAGSPGPPRATHWHWLRCRPSGPGRRAGWWRRGMRGTTAPPGGTLRRARAPRSRSASRSQSARPCL